VARAPACSVEYADFQVFTGSTPGRHPVALRARHHVFMSSSHGSTAAPGGLLCELHAHSRWSDGELALPDVVDLYGRAGFDVLCITDHVVREHAMITAQTHPVYMAEIRREAARARSLFGMLLLPGLELTWDDDDSCRAAHAVAVGLDRFVGLEDGLDAAVETARDHGAAIIAAHPHGVREDSMPGRTTQRWWLDRRLRSLAHRFELINRTQVFEWVAAERLPAVANGDFHQPAHAATWKTVIHADRDPAAVVSHLRSAAPAMIVQPEVTAVVTTAAAAAVAAA
jgi:3',5'-nucleoside bisphosphate phosphatase